MISAKVSFILLTHFRKHTGNMMFIFGTICTESFTIRTEIYNKKEHFGFMLGLKNALDYTGSLHYDSELKREFKQQIRRDR